MSDLSYILNHLGEDREGYFNAVSPPIIQSSNFAFPNLASFRTSLLDEKAHHLYTRGNNPTVEILSKKLAALEKTEDALIFSSGAAAIASAILSFVKQGDHIICVAGPYSWTKKLLVEFLPDFGVTTSFVDARSIAPIEAAIRDTTRMLILESPNTLTFELQDLAACAELAKRHGIITCIDNSYCSPYFQNPAALGIDLVMHSATKYINGHSDVVAGVICGSKAHIHTIYDRTYMTLGAVVSPSDAALMIRGLRTLPLRMERSESSTRLITQRLKHHPAVEQILYPGDPDFPQAPLARRQMRGSGGLFSILVREKRMDKIVGFVDGLTTFLIAVSWGGHESLVLPSAAFHQLPDREDSPYPINLIRFYIGLEEPDYLWEDLKRGLDALMEGE